MPVGAFAILGSQIQDTLGVRRMQANSQELLNIDFRNKNGIDMFNPYREPSEAAPLSPQLKKTDPARRSKRRGNADKGSSRPYGRTAVQP